MQLKDCELEIEKIGKKIYISQKISVVEADESEHVEDWLIAEGELIT